jgi:hypothetical protein
VVRLVLAVYFIHQFPNSFAQNQAIMAMNIMHTIHSCATLPQQGRMLHIQNSVHTTYDQSCFSTNAFANICEISEKNH